MSLFLVYAICFGVGLLFTIISAFMAEVFGGGHDHGGAHEGHTDLGTAGHAEAGYNMPGFSAFSPTVLASFLTAFGGFGMIFSRIEATESVWISAPLSIAVALVIAAGVLWLFRQLFQKTQSSSESRVAALAGTLATVITPIPAGGVGEIAYVHGGTRYTAPARAENAAALTNGQTAKITRIIGSQFYVVPADPEKT
jgi:membrane protein implicated in regulation of membrane protease activity